MQCYDKRWKPMDNEGLTIGRGETSKIKLNLLRTLKTV